jgi:hypothetical protein
MRASLDTIGEEASDEWGPPGSGTSRERRARRRRAHPPASVGSQATRQQTWLVERVGPRGKKGKRPRSRLTIFLFFSFCFYFLVSYLNFKFEFKCCGELVVKIQNKHTSMDRLYLFTYLFCITSFLVFSYFPILIFKFKLVSRFEYKCRNTRTSS